MKGFYNSWYRFGTPPWVGGPRAELVRLVESGGLRPGRAIDLGCGVGDNAVFLAQHRFEVTAVDFAPAAIARAEEKARQAGVDVDFVVDDLTRLTKVSGPFDVLVDYGTFDDLGPRQRAAYVEQVVPLAAPGARFLLWCFEWEPRLWERAATAVLPFGGLALRPGEAERWFADRFDVERIAGETGLPSWPRGWAAYLMARR
ncbi:class I SAM-dependent methyltransferase [Sinomonas halotolerans]|uniref:Class I SAM-dependent methyltransferase n=1 Tax=Sinomonas halotolerans TaxID=1644133 RepID=A0ABU9WZ06_9MICC